MTLAGKGAWIAGTDRPEIETVRIGFMPLADCAPLVMASVLGFDEQYGVRFELTRENFRPTQDLQLIFFQ